MNVPTIPVKKPEKRFVPEQNPPVRFLSLTISIDENLGRWEHSRNGCLQSTMAIDDDELDQSKKKTIKERLRSHMSRRGGKSNRIESAKSTVSSLS